LQIFWCENSLGRNLNSKIALYAILGERCTLEVWKMGVRLSSGGPIIWSIQLVKSSGGRFHHLIFLHPFVKIQGSASLIATALAGRGCWTGRGSWPLRLGRVKVPGPIGNLRWPTRLREAIRVSSLYGDRSAKTGWRVCGSQEKRSYLEGAAPLPTPLSNNKYGRKFRTLAHSSLIHSSPVHSSP